MNQMEYQVEVTVLALRLFIKLRFRTFRFHHAPIAHLFFVPDRSPRERAQAFAPANSKNPLWLTEVSK